MNAISGRAKSFAIGLNGKLWPIVFALVIAICAALWHWVIAVPALYYGKVRDVSFVPAKVHAGEEIMIRFKSITWNRLYYSELIQQTLCLVEDNGVRRHMRIDTPIYVIAVPKKRVVGLDKLRPFTIPKDCLPGPAIYNAYAQSKVPWVGVWVYAEVPPVHFEVVAREAQ